MTEKKIAGREIAQACWEEMDNPSCRRVEEKLKAAGYVTPTYRTIHKWQTEGQWTTRKVPRPPRAPEARVRAQRKMDDASPALTGDPRTRAADIMRDFVKTLPPPSDDARSEAPPPDDDGQPKMDAGGSDDPAEVPEWIQEVRDAITGDVSDERLLSVAARTTLRTAIAIEAVLGQMAPQLVAAAPEAVGKLQLAVAESLKAASDPFDRIGAARERAMRTINGGEVIPPGTSDPLADSLNAFKRRHAA